ncbi:hypothetical protein P8A18_19260 [Streptomyces castrisilvae]|uniref:Uncharacterized protein n=1 Tax=Streptomyces castrisilvae TaxID=3033811 RepID=A0ABY9HMR3_9ACTN|nr:hypothetical protein [Streptomyces sp. Mut1]WLQ35429.1 hypothetical protein P8A18_19260 [Streptomyces sp. Mut1]
MRYKDFKYDISGALWSSPAKTEAVYSRVDTPLGEVTLLRGPSSTRTPVALADAWEDWVVTLTGVAEVKVRDLGVPLYAGRKRLESGAEGELNGTEFSIRTHSSLRRSARIIAFDGLGITFTVRRLKIYVHEGDNCVATAVAGDWDIVTPSAAGIMSICLFVWADMAYFLRTPFFRIL